MDERNLSTEDKRTRTNIRNKIGTKDYNKYRDRIDKYIKRLKYIVLDVSSWEVRKYLEFDIIKTIIDNNDSIDKSKDYLSSYSDKEAIRRSYLWNNSEPKAIYNDKCSKVRGYKYSEDEFKDLLLV